MLAKRSKAVSFRTHPIVDVGLIVERPHASVQLPPFAVAMPSALPCVTNQRREARPDKREFTRQLPPAPCDPQMPSFDIVSEVNQVEVRNAVDQANKEIGTRFDFKGSDARVEYDGKVLTLFADDDFKLKQVTDIVVGKLSKRQVDIRALKYGTVDKIAGNKVKQVVTVRTGVEQELGKRIVKLLKDSKLKVQASIQGDAVRVSGAKKDVLQEAIALTRKSVSDFPLQFQNFRD